VPTRPARARIPGDGRRGQRARRARWRGQWRDAQGGRCSLRDGARLVPGRSGQQGQHEPPLGAALTPSPEASRIPAAPGRRCVVCDGAEWSWKQGQALLPQAHQGFASSHGAQARQRGAQAHSGASGQAIAWGEATMTRRSLGTGGQVRGGLRRMQAQSDEAAHAMAHGGDSRDAHRGRPHSRHRRRGGSPVGSGGIASSHTCIGHVRLKRSGAWWYEANSHQRFALRCAKYHRTLDQVFRRYQQRLRESSE
jgi:hypothetical protein